MPSTRRRSPLSAIVDLLGLIAPIVLGFAIAGLVLSTSISPAPKVLLAATVAAAGLVAGGRVFQRALKRRYPPVVFSLADRETAVAEVEDTLDRLGPRNHVIFGVSPADRQPNSPPRARISVRTGRGGRILEQSLDISFQGHHDQPGRVFEDIELQLPAGWQISEWQADDYMLIDAPATASADELVGFALTSADRLLGPTTPSRWKLTFEG